MRTLEAEGRELLAPSYPTQGQVTLAVPLNWDWISRDFFLSVCGLRGAEHIVCPDAHELYQMRNMAVEEAKKAGSQWLLFADADMAFPPTALQRLLSHRLPIVGGLCRQRRPPFEATLYKTEETPEKLSYYAPFNPIPGGGLVEVAGTGCGFLLIEMRVFDKLDAPYFLPQSSTGGLGEDLWFCEHARNAGFKIFVDQDVVIGHLVSAQVYDQGGQPAMAILRGRTHG